MVKNNVFRIVKTLVCTYITTLLMLLIMTLLFYKLQINNSKIMIGVYLILLLISVIVMKEANIFTPDSLFALLACVGGGMLGGMIS